MKLSVQWVLKFSVRGSKCGGAYPRTRRMPPRLGDSVSPPQSNAGRDSGQADSVIPVTRPACSSSRRLTRGAWRAWACGGSMGCPPAQGYSDRAPLTPGARDFSTCEGARRTSTITGPDDRHGVWRAWARPSPSDVTPVQGYPTPPMVRRLRPHQKTGVHCEADPG